MLHPHLIQIFCVILFHKVSHFHDFGLKQSKKSKRQIDFLICIHLKILSQMKIQICIMDTMRFLKESALGLQRIIPENILGYKKQLFSACNLG